MTSRRRRRHPVKISGLIIFFIIITSLLLFAKSLFTKEQSSEEPKHRKPVLALNHLLSNEKSELPETKKLDGYIKQFMRQWGIKGASIAIMQDDRLIYAKGYGWADEEDSVKTEVRHIFRIASVSKLITAVTVMKLVEKGILKLDQKPFAKGGLMDIPEFSEIKDRRVRDITIEELLRHRGGFSRRGGDPMFIPNIIRNRMKLDSAPKTDDIIRYILSRDLSYQPGNGTKYSNFGYVLLSRIIEQATGIPYESYVKNAILAPIGIYDMHIARNFHEQKFPNEVRYYEPHDELMVESFDGSGIMRPKCYGGNDVAGLSGAGGWVASPSELVKFLASIDGRPGMPNILSSESIKIMTTADAQHLPIGWAKARPNGDWTRTGTLSGMSAMIKCQKDGLTWVFLANTSSWKGARFPKIVEGMFNKAFSRMDSLPQRDLFGVTSDEYSETDLQSEGEE
jgi:CubicO group peptidase (beta-lactamase class C family)